VKTELQSFKAGQSGVVFYGANWKRSPTYDYIFRKHLDKISDLSVEQLEDKKVPKIGRTKK